MKDGYAGKILSVDLTSGTSRSIETPAALKSRYLGGCGFGAKLLYDSVPAKADPLGPENVLVLATGPVTGTIIPSSCMTIGVTKSPLTGLFFRSVMGGAFGPEVKQAGFDVLLIQGAAAAPVYLVIEDGKAEVRPADGLWGSNAYATQSQVKARLRSEEFQVAAIGPAGERGVRYASIIAGTRALGRGGLGAVLGAKQLKAIAVRGSQTIRVADPGAVIANGRLLMEKLAANPQSAKAFPTYGSAASPASYSAAGLFGTHNWQTEVFPGAEAISAEANAKLGKHLRTRACSSCVIRSSHVWQAADPPYTGLVSEGPEYETLWSFGGMCGNPSFDAILAADRLCDEYGIDTISAGACIAFAMECFEKGLLTPHDTGGLDLRFGNAAAVVQLVHQIGRREGIGDLVAEGTREMARRLGGSSSDFAMHTKGLEFAGHSSRAIKSMAVGYATSNRGGSHQDTRPAPERSGKFGTGFEGKAQLAKDCQDMTTIGDAGTFCRRMTECSYGSFLTQGIADTLSLVTGEKYTVESLREISERIYATEKLFNVREGAGREADTLPKRFLTEPIPEGPRQGAVIPPEALSRMLDEYYEIRGWDKTTSVPTRQTLERLGLGSYAATKG
jgi:aldehyde:ferredoxin oxidoreductase